VIDLLEPDLEKVRALKESPLGFVAHDTISRDFKSESALGNLIADITKESYEGADIGLANGGPVDQTKIYKIATSDFLAGGGSGVKGVNIPKQNVEVFWDANFILRELAIGVLKEQKKDLRGSDYFRADQPRQKIQRRCNRND